MPLEPTAIAVVNVDRAHQQVPYVTCDCGSMSFQRIPSPKADEQLFRCCMCEARWVGRALFLGEVFEPSADDGSSSWIGTVGQLPADQAVSVPVTGV